MMNGEEVTTTYEPVDSDDTDKVAPGKTAMFSVELEFDPAVEHKWKYGTREGTVANGLGDYACIKAAIRNYGGKAPVTMDDINAAEEEQKKKFEEFEKSEKEK